MKQGKLQKKFSFGGPATEALPLELRATCLGPLKQELFLLLPQALYIFQKILYDPLFLNYNL